MTVQVFLQWHAKLDLKNSLESENGTEQGISVKT